jgi:hypothetical protein
MKIEIEEKRASSVAVFARIVKLSALVSDG